MDQQAWTDERVWDLPEVWEKHSAAEIAKMWGVSRNSVIGRVHRLRNRPTPGMRRHHPQWPPAAVELLRDNWHGNGSGVIARLLGEHGFRFSRNAVLNKGRRLGLPLKVRGEGERVPRVSSGVRTKAVRTRADGAPAHWGGAPINILDDGLRHFQCRYIVDGAGVSTMFCGAPTSPEDALTFCAHHKHFVTAPVRSSTVSRPKRFIL